MMTNGDSIMYLVKLQKQEMAKWYNVADVVAFPSVRREGDPYVVREAAACGTPVVSLQPIPGVNGLVYSSMKDMVDLLASPRLRDLLPARSPMIPQNLEAFTSQLAGSLAAHS